VDDFGLWITFVDNFWHGFCCELFAFRVGMVFVANYSHLEFTGLTSICLIGKTN